MPCIRFGYPYIWQGFMPLQFSRKTSIFLNGLINNWLPPALRDAAWFMRPMMGLLLARKRTCSWSSGRGPATFPRANTRIFTNKQPTATSSGERISTRSA